MKKLICVAAAFLLLALTACVQDTQPTGVTDGQSPSITLLEKNVSVRLTRIRKQLRHYFEERGVVR